MHALSRRLSGKALIARFRAVLGEFMKFGVVGAINLVVNFLVFLALATTVFAGGELKANVVAFIVATTSSYLMNRHWTFRHRPRSTRRREYALFFLFNVAGLAIELAVMGLAKYGLGMKTLVPLTIAKAIGIGLGTIFRFYTYRTFVFSSRRITLSRAFRAGVPSTATPAENTGPQPTSDQLSPTGPPTTP